LLGGRVFKVTKEAQMLPKSSKFIGLVIATGIVVASGPAQAETQPNRPGHSSWVEMVKFFAERFVEHEVEDKNSILHNHDGWKKACQDDVVTLPDGYTYPRAADMYAPRPSLWSRVMCGLFERPRDWRRGKFEK
jgi:hypothetical protein